MKKESDSRVIPFPGLEKRREESGFERLFDLDEDALAPMRTADLRDLLHDIEAAYALYGDDAGLAPGSEEWNDREEKMEFLDDLTDAVWDILDGRGE